MSESVLTMYQTMSVKLRVDEGRHANLCCCYWTFGTIVYRQYYKL